MKTQNVSVDSSFRDPDSDVRPDRDGIARPNTSMKSTHQNMPRREFNFQGHCCILYLTPNQDAAGNFFSVFSLGAFMPRPSKNYGGRFSVPVSQHCARLIDSEIEYQCKTGTLTSVAEMLGQLIEEGLEARLTRRSSGAVKPTRPEDNGSPVESEAV